MDYMARLRCKYFVAKWKDGRITKNILRGVKMMEKIENFRKRKKDFYNCVKVDWVSSVILALENYLAKSGSVR